MNHPPHTATYLRFRISQITLFVICGTSWLSAQEPPPVEPPIPIPIPMEQSASGFMDAVEAHMDYVTEHSYDQVGERTTPMWLSAIDLRTNGLPEPLMPSSPRWNGLLLSAAGANLYWDQPTILAAFELSKRTGCKCYSDSASAYINSFFGECDTSKSNPGMDPRFYYDIRLEKLINTTSTLLPCMPYTPAWETAWAANTELARKQIQAFINHKTAKAPFGGSSRLSTSDLAHAAKQPPMLAIERETALIASLCWLAQQDPSQKNQLTKQALALAQRRMNHRNIKTGLVPTEFNASNQDGNTCSLQIGAWAGVLLRATEVTGEPEFQNIAKEALHPWLTLGFNLQQKQYYKQLDCNTGHPIKLSEAGITPGKGTVTDSAQATIFAHVNRPAYQSPLRMAEACLSLHEKTGDKPSQQAVQRWINIIKQSLPANEGRGGYAEDYGRAIHFLVRASKILHKPECRTLAQDLANDAMKQLYVPKMGMFRSHPGENRCDSADGPGFLLLALMYMEGNDPTQDSVLQF
ncbi:hypothetical protein OAF37_03930 [Rubripirellula sp.]|nr:hypothetical protein [Rubripirellula sp.]MDB4645187.1 hypothetical protein [Rubripirellula sp.]